MRYNALCVAIILALSALVYLPSLRGDFIWDDRPLILDDTQVHSFTGLSRLFVRDFFAPGAEDSKYGYYRPVISLSYMIDWAVWGPNPLGFRLTNLFWHLLSTFLLFWLVRRLFPDSSWIPLLCAGLFGLHPAHTESVAWIAGRTDVICTALSLGSLIAWHYFLAKNKPRLAWVSKGKARRPERQAVGACLTAAILFLAALMAKEMAVVVPLVAVALAWLTVLERDSSRLKLLLPEALGYSFFLIVYIVLRFFVAHVGVSAPSPQHSLWKALATFPSAFADYLIKLIAPVQLNAYIVWPYVIQPFSLFGAIGLLVMAAAIFLALRFRKTRPMISLGVAAFLLGFLPLANLVRISGPSDMGFVMAERFLYLPSALLFILLAAGLAWLSSLPKKTAFHAALIGGLALGAAFGVRSAYAARVWTDESQVYEHALALSPDAPLMWTNLGAHYRRQGRFDEALAALRKAESINERLKSADPLAIYNNLGTALASQGHLAEALSYFDKALAVGGQTDQVQFNRGESLRLLNRGEEALAAYNASLKANPDYLDPRLRRAQIYFAMGKLNEAKADLQEVLNRNPDQSDALANLGMLARREGKLEDASLLLYRALRLKPENYQAWMALGGIEGQRGKFADSAVAFQRASDLAPDVVEPHLALAAALFKSGKPDQAKSILDEMRAKHPDNAQVLIHLLHWYYESKDLEKARETLREAKRLAPDDPQVLRYISVLGDNP